MTEYGQPEMEPQISQIPSQIPNNHPYPYIAFTPYVVPFVTSIGAPINAFKTHHYIIHVTTH